MRKLHRQRVQGPARHVMHGLFLRQDVTNVERLQGIGQLQAEKNALGLSRGLKRANHGYGLFIAGVVLKSSIRHNRRKAQLVVEDASQ